MSIQETSFIVHNMAKLNHSWYIRSLNGDSCHSFIYSFIHPFKSTPFPILFLNDLQHPMDVDYTQALCSETVRYSKVECFVTTHNKAIVGEDNGTCGDG